jgi:hypothetical protein
MPRHANDPVSSSQLVPTEAENEKIEVLIERIIRFSDAAGVRTPFG